MSRKKNGRKARLIRVEIRLVIMGRKVAHFFLNLSDLPAIMVVLLLLAALLLRLAQGVSLEVGVSELSSLGGP